jgi:CHASE3 domain sensor protein
MASVGELLDLVRDQLTNDPLVSAAVSSVISPEGRALLAEVVTKLAALESQREQDKAAAVQAAHEAGKAEGAASAAPEAPAE